MAVIGSGVGSAAGGPDGSAGAEAHAVSVSRPLDSVGELFRVHRLDLLRLAMFLTSDHGLAEDLVQDAFAGLQRRWSELRDSAAALGYLRVSVVNGARSALRRRALLPRLVRVADPASVPGADFTVLVGEEHRAVLAALREIPRRQREVLVLRYWADLGEKEIAATLGISPGTVKSSAARGLKALQRRMEAER